MRKVVTLDWSQKETDEKTLLKKHRRILDGSGVTASDRNLDDKMNYITFRHHGGHRLPFPIDTRGVL